MALDLNGIMIGDLVAAQCTYEDMESNEVVEEMHPFKITGISPDRQLSDGVGNFGMSFLGEYLDDCEIENIEDLCPIELTEDILKANGFIPLVVRPRSQRWSRLDEAGNNIWVELFEGKLHFGIHYAGRAFYMLDVIITYIHELQHLLRVIGEKEWANNFKLK